MRRRNSRKYRRFPLPEISLTPLIDTALTLLVIFMVTAPMIQHGIRVDLPSGATKEVKDRQDLVVTISKDEKIFFNSFPVEKAQLLDTVKKAMGEREDIPVHVWGDEKVSYGKVIEIVDTLKGSVKYVALATRSMQQR